MKKEGQIPGINDWNARAASEWRDVADLRLQREAKASQLLVGARRGLLSIQEEVWQGRGSLQDQRPVGHGQYAHKGVRLEAEYPEVFPKTREVRDKEGVHCDNELVGVSQKASSVSLSIGVDLPQLSEYSAYTRNPLIFRFISRGGKIEHAALRDFKLKPVLHNENQEEGVVYFVDEGREKQKLELLFADPIKHAKEIAQFFDKALLGYVMAGDAPNFEWKEKFAEEYRALLKANIGMTGFNAIRDLGNNIGR